MMILEAAFRVHSRVGPGLSESVFQQGLTYELKKRGLSVEAQKSVPIYFDQHRFEAGSNC
jgi:GxxExxY protein